MSYSPLEELKQVLHFCRVWYLLKIVLVSSGKLKLPSFFSNHLDKYLFGLLRWSRANLTWWSHIFPLILSNHKPLFYLNTFLKTDLSESCPCDVRWIWMTRISSFRVFWRSFGGESRYPNSSFHFAFQGLSVK